MQSHELILRHHNTIKAEDLIEEFQKLWDASFNSHKQINDQIKPDLLYYSIKMCREKIPPLLEIPKTVNFTPESFIGFALYEVSYIKSIKTILK